MMEARERDFGAPARLPRVAALVRVSTDQQTVEHQRHAIKMWCKRNAEESGVPDIPIVEWYEEPGYSGALPRNRRPVLVRMLKDMKANKFDLLVVWSLDRLSRRSIETLSIVDEFRAHGVNLISLQQKMDTTTPFGMAMLTMCSMLAQLERDVISERTKAAIAAMRARGKPVGGMPREMTPWVREMIVAAGSTSAPWRWLAPFIWTRRGRRWSPFSAYALEKAYLGLVREGLAPARTAKWCNFNMTKERRLEIEKGRMAEAVRALLRVVAGSEVPQIAKSRVYGLARAVHRGTARGIPQIHIDALADTPEPVAGDDLPEEFATPGK